MRKLYIFMFLSLTAFITKAHAQRSAIKRASLSASVVGAHVIQKGKYKVQQSIAHMGIMGSVTHDTHTTTRGFLVPQMGSSSEKPLPDFNWGVYPNPFITHINIDFDAPVSGNMAIRVHDVTGQIVFEKAVSAKQQQRIHLGNLARAEYLLNVEVMGKTFSQILLNYERPNGNN